MRADGPRSGADDGDAGATSQRVCALRRARAALVRAWLLHTAWFVIMCVLAVLHWRQAGVRWAVLLTLFTVPPVLVRTVRVHRLCRAIDPAAPTVGWVPVLVTLFVLSPSKPA